MAYGYDAQNRLIQIDHTDSANTFIAQQTYTLGPEWSIAYNVDELDGTQTQYGYDALYRLTQEAVNDPVNGNRASVWTYDAVGNRLTQDKLMVS